MALPSKNKEARQTTGKDWVDGDRVFLVAETDQLDDDTGSARVRVYGEVVELEEGGYVAIFEADLISSETSGVRGPDVYKDYPPH